MSRIRSVHPGLWTDESFVTLSPLARLFCVGIWTECDDHGVFEWKPLVLKMRLLPADHADAAPLMDELTSANVARRFTAEGKEYGVIRNFCRYQRPKKPAYRFPMPNEFRTFVGLKDDSSPPVTPSPPTEGEKSPQMEDEGGRRDKEKKVVRAVGKPTRPEADENFEQFWKAYPSRGEAANPRKPAHVAFGRLLRQGHDASEIIQGAKRYREAEVRARREGTDKVAQAITWLNQERWSDYAPQAEPSPQSAVVHVMQESPEWPGWAVAWRETKGKDPPIDKTGGWYFPVELAERALQAQAVKEAAE